MSPVDRSSAPPPTEPRPYHFPHITRTTLPIPAALDQLVLACLAKEPAHRPQSAKELSGRLAAIGDPGAWTQEHAHDWWTAHQPGIEGRAPVAT